jgi:hypothetical protein
MAPKKRRSIRSHLLLFSCLPPEIRQQIQLLIIYTLRVILKSSKFIAKEVKIVDRGQYNGLSNRGSEIHFKL